MSPSKSGPANPPVAKAALWIGISTTVAICALGWVGGLVWVVARGGPGALIEHTAEIFYVAAGSLLCAAVASASAAVAMRWRGEAAPRSIAASPATTTPSDSPARVDAFVPASASGGAPLL
jgi:hypothetical protein